VALEPIQRGQGEPGEAPAACADVDLAAVAHNAREAARLAGGRTLFAVVKADAYGHGAAAVARTLVTAGCPRLSVLTVEEGAALRDEGLDVPILVMRGAGDRHEAREAARLGLTPVVHDVAGLDRLAEAGREERPVAVHVEVDTGMRRMGVAPRAAVDLMARVEAQGGVRLEGVFTHFARADEPDLEPTLEQLRSFRGVLDEAARAGLRPEFVHVANSAGLLAGEAIEKALPGTNAARPGLMLYGVRPAPHLDAADLRPAMTLRARVAAVHALAPGDPVGYAATFRADRPTRVATLALGYADGVPWSAANTGRVWLGGALRPMVGRVSMDYTAVLVDDAPVSVGDEAIFFGTTPDGVLPVEEAATAAGTLSYELLVRVGARVPRRFQLRDTSDRSRDTSDRSRGSGGGGSV
jgi:alanine racemase